MRFISELKEKIKTVMAVTDVFLATAIAIVINLRIVHTDIMAESISLFIITQIAVFATVYSLQCKAVEALINSFVQENKETKKYRRVV